MSFNPEKMANIILNECESIEERYQGYRKDLVDVIVEILRAEKEHSLKGINIRQQINDACKDAGDFLANKRDIAETTGEDIQ